jgi:hypothetical protein
MSTYKKNAIKYVIPLCISVTTLGFGIYSKIKGAITPLPVDVEWITFILISLLTPLYAILAHVQIYLQSDITDLSGNVQKAISDGKVIYLGNASHAVENVISRLDSTTEILNTYIISESAYSAQTQKSVENAITKFIKRPDTRMEETCSEQGKLRLDSIKKDCGGALPTTYKARVIKTEASGLPACNFIILVRSPNDPTPEEIFFGWGYFHGNPNESVFWSNDKDLIGFFKGYHKALRQDKVSVEYH